LNILNIPPVETIPNKLNQLNILIHEFFWKSPTRGNLTQPQTQQKTDY